MTATIETQEVTTLPELLHATLDCVRNAALGVDSSAEFKEHLAALRAVLAEEDLPERVSDELLSVLDENHQAAREGKPLEPHRDDLERALETLQGHLLPPEQHEHDLGHLDISRITNLVRSPLQIAAVVAAAGTAAGCGVTSTQGALGSIGRVAAEECYERAGSDRTARAACREISENSSRIVRREARQADQRDQGEHRRGERARDIEFQRGVELSEVDHQKAIELRQSYSGADLERLYNRCIEIVDQTNSMARRQGRPAQASIETVPVMDDERRTHACRVVAGALQAASGTPRQR